jgi:LPS-assembly protein
MIRFALAVSCLLLSLSGIAWSQAPSENAVLVADDVEVTRDGVLTARGNVEVFQGQVSLEARSISYDRTTDTLTFEGPLVLRDGASVLILASEAELDSDLRNGILRSARLVIDQQMQLAAVQINRVDARYSQLYKAAVTSCRVCNDGRPPLWQIRAKRIVHDREERQLYLDGVQFRVGNVPIIYLPRLRLPDPTLERATGFLIPSIRTTSQLSTGVKIPYFITLGDHRDLTLTPYLSPETATLEFRYRQAFRKGRIDFNGAVTTDNLRPEEERFYLFGAGYFALPRGFRLDFNVEVTSDDAYLNQYAYSYKDRLDSALTVSRTRRDEFISAGIIGYHSLRVGENDSTLPTVVVDTLYERRYFPKAVGGELRFGLVAHSHLRDSDDPVDGSGRDVTRFHGDIRWLRGWSLPGGVRADTRLGVAFDAFDTRQDNIYGGTESRTFSHASLTLRYPLTRTEDDGARQFVEPVVQLAMMDGQRINVANDESTLVEFDEGNLFALSRFPETDRRETGSVLAVGLNWARYDPDGWESYVSIGQIFRDPALSDFSKSSGLSGTQSDLLVAGQIKTQSGLSVGGRVLFDDSFEFSKAEFRGFWARDAMVLGGSYLWLVDDPVENRTRPISEFTLDGSYRINRHWRLSGNWRYDIEDDRTALAGVGLGYDNECVTVLLSMERRYYESTTVEPTTNFGFTIGLRGFSAQTETESFRRSCS